MAYTTINKSSLHMNTKLYVGDGSNTQAITGVGFQPDLTWIKSRDATHDHYSFDAVRTNKKGLEPSDTSAERTPTLGSFDSDGFTFASTDGFYNTNSGTYVAWNWKANGSGSANTDGDINSTVSVNTTAGFSIVKYTGNGSSNQSIGHGLGVRPKMIWVKNLDTAGAWMIWGESFNSGSGVQKFLQFTQLDNANTGSAGDFPDEPTTSVFKVGSYDTMNKSGDNIIAYCFAEITGYSKFGMYHNNGNANGPFVYTGFKPAFVLVKSSDRNTSNWNLLDDKRPGYNVTDYRIKISATAEQTGNVNCIDILSNGFKLRGVDDDMNASGPGDDYIYYAVGQSLVGSNDIPCTAF